jgi:acetate---CoA ligase (ADP-forming) subunit beta
MKVQEIFTKAKIESRNLFEPEAYQVLDNFGIPIPKFGVAATENEAVMLSKSIGYPVVLKAVSPQISHKSDVNAVILSINSDDEVGDAYAQLIASMEKIDPEIDLRGVLVSKMMPKGREVIIGMTRDPQFGPAVLFGLGGIFVEVLKDVSYRVAPVTEKDARQMIVEIKGYPLLRGVRNSPPSDIKTIIEIIQKVSELAVELPEIAELDLNPVLVYEHGACVVDARIILDSRLGTS